MPIIKRAANSDFYEIPTRKPTPRDRPIPFPMSPFGDTPFGNLLICY
jgi:hypothetical protein